MHLPPDILLQDQLRAVSRYLSLAILAIGLVMLAAWKYDIYSLKYALSSQVAMNPVTAVGFVLSGLSLWLMIKQIFRKAAVTMASLVFLTGLLKLLGLAADNPFDIDTLLFPGKLAKDEESMLLTRMAPNSAVGFLLCSLSMIAYSNKSKKSVLPSQYIALLIALLGLLSLLGYLYQVEGFYGILSYVPMSVASAICFFLFALSNLFSRPGEGIMKDLTSTQGGSFLGRLLIPAAIIIPSVLGLLRLYGTWEGIYNYEFGAAIYVLSVIIIFVGITWYYAALLNRRDMLKQRSDLALRESESHLQALFNDAPDAVIVMDSEGIVTRWNAESEKLFGWNSGEAVGKVLSEMIIPAQFREAHKKGLHRYLTRGESTIIGRTIDLWAVRKDGTEVDVSIRISPLLLDGRHFFVGFIRDITDRKQLEDKLRSFNEELSKKVEEKTRELTNIFERVTDGFIALDKDLRYTYMNKKAGKITRREPATMIGRNVWDVFPDAVGTDTYHAIIRAMEEQRFVTNIDYYAPLDLWQQNFIYPSPEGLSVFVRDITEQKRSEREINKVKDLADKLIDSLPGIFYFFDANGKFIRWNKQLEEVTGYTPDEIASMHPLDFFPEEHKGYIAERIQGVFEKGMNDAEANILTKSGEKIPYYFRAVRIQYESGPCLLGNGIDITERKKWEQDLQASEQKYKLLFESNPLPMWMLSLPDYKIIDVNNVALEQYGYSREEFLNLSVLDLRPEEERERYLAAREIVFRGIHHSGVWKHIRKNGTTFYVDIVTHDIFYKGSPTRLVLANDVSEKYIAEEKLRESYESIRTLTSHLQNVREEERLHIAREIHDELGQLLTVLKMDVSWLNKKTAPENTLAKEKLAGILTLIDTTVKTVRRIASELRPSLLDDLGLLAAMEWHLDEFEKRSGIGKELLVPEIEMELPDSLKIGLFRIFQESLTNVARHSGAKKVSVTLLQEDKQLILTIKDDGNGFEETMIGEKKTLGLLGMKERTTMMGGTYSLSSLKDEGTTVSVSVPLPVNGK